MIVYERVCDGVCEGVCGPHLPLRWKLSRGWLRQVQGASSSRRPPVGIFLTNWPRGGEDHRSSISGWRGRKLGERKGRGKGEGRGRKGSGRGEDGEEGLTEVRNKSDRIRGSCTFVATMPVVMMVGGGGVAVGVMAG